MMTHSTQLKLQNSFDQSEKAAPILRVFKTENSGLLAITGEDFDNHELWLLNGQQAQLLGTANEVTFKHLKRSRVLNLTVTGTSFDWINEDLLAQWANKTLTGRVDTEPLHQPVYSYSQATYQYDTTYKVR